MTDLMPDGAAWKSFFGRRIQTVTEINERAKDTLEANFGLVAVAGETGDLFRARSGHVYFTLRDSKAQLRGVLWRGTAEKLPFTLTEGMEVAAFGRLTVYPKRGTYQIVVSELIPRGIGEIQRALEALRRKLTGEGLFDEDRKKPLPCLPLRLGVITSPSGAAVHDIIRTAVSRFPGISIRLLPVRVQGSEAPKEIVQALEKACMEGVCDVVLLGRGGGGVEDLWAFNMEQVVRAVAGCKVPVVSCVGHETDVTLSDLAADVRVSTPTRAAEVAVPVVAEILGRLEDLRKRAVNSMRRVCERRGGELDRLAARPGFSEPKRKIGERCQYLDELLYRLENGLCTVGRKAYNDLNMYRSRLEGASPLRILERGYSITRFSSGSVVRSVCELAEGGSVEVRFWDGFCGADVRFIRKESLGSKRRES